MAIEKIGYYEANLDTIERSASQARQTNVNANLEDLLLSIQVQGLMEPVLLVEIVPDKKYELIDGQRRFQAYLSLQEKDPGKFSKIPSFKYKNTMEDWEKKAISINANLTQQPMDEIDRINGVTAVFNQFDSIKLTKQHTGLSEYTIRKYVKFNRLPKELKDAVEKGDLKVNSAIDAADLYDYDPDNTESFDTNDMFETAKEMQKLAAKQKHRVKQKKKADPTKPTREIIKEVKETKRTSKSITLEVESDTYGRLDSYKDKKELDSVESAVVDLIESGLDSNQL